MINIFNDNLVIEEKGIYSIEQFLIARRLMYWQVYLHKTVLSAEHTLMNVLKRAKYLAKKFKSEIQHLVNPSDILIFAKNNKNKGAKIEIIFPKVK